MQASADIFEIVKTAVEELNADLQSTVLATVEPTTPLFGGSGPLDSLALVRLIANLEMKVEDSFAAPIVLADEKAMSQGNPYRTVQTLVDLITQRLAESNV